MSTSYSALTVVGVLFNDLKPQKFTKRSTVTRYNSVTGEPFEKEIITDFIRLGNKEFELDNYYDLVSYLSDFDNGLESFALNDPANLSECEIEYSVVLGYRVHDNDANEYNQGIIPLEEDRIAVAKTRAKEWFKNFLLCEVDVKLYTILSVSY